MKNAAQCKEKYPVRAIADGKIVACRLGSKYWTSEFKEKTLSYSGDFCLIEHTYSYEDGDAQKSFVFYSLYMHLAQLAESSMTQHDSGYSLPDWRYTRVAVKTTADRALRGRADPVDGYGGARLFVISPLVANWCIKWLKHKTSILVVHGTQWRLVRYKLQSPLKAVLLSKAWVCVDDKFVERIAAKNT